MNRSPSKHTKPKPSAPPPTRRVGPSASQEAELPRARGRRNAAPKRVRDDDGSNPETRH